MIDEENKKLLASKWYSLPEVLSFVPHIPAKNENEIVGDLKYPLEIMPVISHCAREFQAETSVLIFKGEVSARGLLLVLGGSSCDIGGGGSLMCGAFKPSAQL